MHSCMFMNYILLEGEQNEQKDGRTEGWKAGYNKVNKYDQDYDQEIPQSHTADHHVAP